jgi:hypothetical protein
MDTGDSYRYDSGPATQIAAAFFAHLLSVLAITGPVIWVNKQRAMANGRRVLLRRSKEQTFSRN